MSEFRILTVCTANICRSRAAEAFLRHDLTGASAPVASTTDTSTAATGSTASISISSAGTDALPGHPGCEYSRTLVTEFLGEAPPQDGPGSRRVTKESVAAADLVLALDRGHRGTLARLSPRSRPRTFTLRQAACLAEHIRETLAAGELPEGAPPLPPPDDPTARLAWLVAEMDAARGVCAAPPASNPDDGYDPLDVPDPHVIGFEHHPPAIALIREATSNLSGAIRAVLQHAA